MAVRMAGWLPDPSEERFPKTCQIYLMRLNLGANQNYYNRSLEMVNWTILEPCLYPSACQSSSTSTLLSFPDQWTQVLSKWELYHTSSMKAYSMKQVRSFEKYGDSKGIAASLFWDAHCSIKGDAVAGLGRDGAAAGDPRPSRETRLLPSPFAAAARRALSRSPRHFLPASARRSEWPHGKSISGLKMHPNMLHQWHLDTGIVCAGILCFTT